MLDVRVDLPRRVDNDDERLLLVQLVRQWEVLPGVGLPRSEPGGAAQVCKRSFEMA